MSTKLKPWQISGIIGVISVFGMGNIMAITNPSRQDYQTYAARQTISYLQNNACTKLPDTLSGFLHEQCSDLVKEGKPYFKQAINVSTRQHNYLLFTVYETEVSLNNRLPSYSSKTVGFMSVFWTYEAGLDKSS
ncbi:DUF4359 domain-containing protein [Euhalothece natronophila Z-M001]|uniref:DUF4359 domain-containing protein n=1 Tax=Euhalothece natronophila Z-M001 TaxID=522448 RepID=A0A5B8NMQ4_9CHRO|nr:DUF4359 domain-containing protein [Euhalothece natronophila]QDZ40216.1 DUF4359 domain-containing protein [Euhalothece natronophila Z-M001]